MSNIGMERHEFPDFKYQDLDDIDGPSFWWTNPYNGRREKIASLFWPAHPVEATEAIENLFENLKLTYGPPNSTLTEETARLKERVRVLEGALEKIDEMPYYAGEIPETQIEGLRARYHKALDIARSALHTTPEVGEEHPKTCRCEVCRAWGA